MNGSSLVHDRYRTPGSPPSHDGTSPRETMVPHFAELRQQRLMCVYYIVLRCKQILVSNIFYFPLYLQMIGWLIDVFNRGYNHQPAILRCKQICRMISLCTFSIIYMCLHLFVLILYVVTWYMVFFDTSMGIIYIQKICFLLSGR